MSETPLPDSMKKLKAAHPDAPAWIFDRAEIIADQRLEQAERNIFLKNTSMSLAGTFGRAVISGFGAMLNIFDSPDYTKARQDARRKTISGPNSIGQSFEWAFENLRQATCDYITEHDVPLDIFTDTEQKHLFPSGLPAKDHGNKPHAAL
jgi:hypothetical protein